MGRYSRMTGWGKYLPQRVLTNAELAEMVDTSDEWIRERTGIRERRIAGENETTATMSLVAAREALEVAGLDAADLDLIIVATSSPDYLLPPVSSMIQDSLGARKAGAFELRAGCTGFLYALIAAHQFIATGTYDKVLVIGAELISRFVNWEDRNTCILFGDGAGAVVLQAALTPTGVLSFALGSDGSMGEALMLRGGGCRFPFGHEALDEKDYYLTMEGPRVFRFATRVLGKATREVVEASGLCLEDVDLLIPHQANLRIIHSACKALDLPEEKVFINLDRYGNTSAASIPVALCEALEEGRIEGGDNIVLVGFGGGLTYAAAVVRWGVQEQLLIPTKSISWSLSPRSDAHSPRPRPYSRQREPPCSLRFSCRCLHGQERGGSGIHLKRTIPGKRGVSQLPRASSRVAMEARACSC